MITKQQNKRSKKVEKENNNYDNRFSRPREKGLMKKCLKKTKQTRWWRTRGAKREALILEIMILFSCVKDEKKAKHEKENLDKDEHN